MDKYRTIINEDEFIWRELTRREFKEIIEIEDPFIRDERICEICVIQPKSYDFQNCHAGIPATLAKEIIDISGFSENSGQEIFEQYRTEFSVFENQIPLIICAAFHKYIPEDIEKWSMRKILWYLAQAEVVLNIRGTPVTFTKEEAKEVDYDAFPELMAEKRFLRG